MKTWEEIAEELEALMNDNADAISPKAIKAQQLIHEAIVVMVLDLAQQGKLPHTKAVVNQLSAITPAILNALTKSGYIKQVESYLLTFDSIEQYNTMIQQRLNGVAVDMKPLSTYRKQVLELVHSQMLGAGLSSNFTEPLRQILTRHAIMGVSIKETLDSVNGFINGNKAQFGGLEKQATQIARDAIFQYDGAVKGYIAQEYKMDAYVYLGGLVRDSRPQCVRWVSMGVLPMDKLDKEIAWAYRNGKGMIPGTNAGNFASLRGGFNCRHSAHPTFLDKQLGGA